MLDYNSLPKEKKVLLQTIEKFGHITPRGISVVNRLKGLKRLGWVDTNDTIYYFTPEGKAAYEAAQQPAPATDDSNIEIDEPIPNTQPTASFPAKLILNPTPAADASARECQHGNDPAQCEECTPHEADEPVININGRDLTEDQADTAIRQIAERAALGNVLSELERERDEAREAVKVTADARNDIARQWRELEAQLAEARRMLKIAVEVCRAQLDPEHIAHNHTNWEALKRDFERAARDGQEG